MQIKVKMPLRTIYFAGWSVPSPLVYWMSVGSFRNDTELGGFNDRS
jgi:hypothetical protein